MKKHRLIQAAVLFTVGAVLGPVGDSFHVLSHTTAYPERYRIGLIPILEVPFWVAVELGLAVLCVGLFHAAADKWLCFRLLKSIDPLWLRRGAKTWYFVAIGIIIMLGLWAESAFLPLSNGGQKDIVIGAGALLAWLVLDGTGRGIILGVTTAIVGVLGEMALEYRGVFYYVPEQANLFGVPSWLPWLYFMTSIAVGNLATFLMMDGARQFAHAARQR